jgi:hypothetical protein
MESIARQSVVTRKSFSLSKNAMSFRLPVPAVKLIEVSVCSGQVFIFSNRILSLGSHRLGFRCLDAGQSCGAVCGDGILVYPQEACDEYSPACSNCTVNRGSRLF